MTSTIVDAIQKLQEFKTSGNGQAVRAEPGLNNSLITHDVEETTPLDEPSLQNPAIGNPISHIQLLYISRKLKNHDLSLHHLDILLQGSSIYIAPPPPKKDPVSNIACQWKHI